MRTASDVALDVWKSLPDFGDADAEAGIDVIANALTAFRNEGIEQAAQVAHNFVTRKVGSDGCCSLAEKIRALKK